MKTLLLLFILGFCCPGIGSSVFAQQGGGLLAKGSVAPSDQIQFGGFIGLNLSGAIVKYPAYPVSGARPGPGFEIGGFADVPLKNKQYSFRPSLSYSLERASAVVEGDRSSIHVSFIKLPLDFVYHSTYKKNPLFFGAGPFVAYNLGGKYNWANTRVQSISFGSDQGDFGRTYKRVDFGLSLLGGYQLNEKIVLGAHFDFGLLNMIHMTEDPDEAKKASIHTLNLSFTAGYLFGGK